MPRCLICNTEFPTEIALHRHVSMKEKVKTPDYYTQYYPRYDKLTGDLIQFKNKEFYFHSLFNTRANLIQYIKANPKDVDVILEVLRLRKEAKKLITAPSTIEARTSILPTPLLLERAGYNYNELCEYIGLKSRFDFKAALEFDKTKTLSVLRDTREQHPLPFYNCTVTKLDFCDYTSSSHYKKVFIERKSLPDLCGTLSKGFERFQRELERAKALDSYIVVCVETDLNDIFKIGKAYGTTYTQATPEFICSRIRELLHNYEHLQFLFVKGRVELVRVVERIFRLTNDIKTVDIQYAYDAGKL